MAFTSGYHAKDESCINIQTLLNWRCINGRGWRTSGEVIVFINGWNYDTWWDTPWELSQIRHWCPVSRQFGNDKGYNTAGSCIHRHETVASEETHSCYVVCVVYSSHRGMDDDYFHDGEISFLTTRNGRSGYVMLKCTLCLTLFQVMRDIRK